jgi:hypothetical protein
MERAAGIAGGAAVSGFAVVGMDVAVDDARSEEGEQELAMMARATTPVAKTRVARIMIHATRTAAAPSASGDIVARWARAARWHWPDRSMKATLLWP